VSSPEPSSNIQYGLGSNRRVRCVALRRTFVIIFVLLAGRCVCVCGGGGGEGGLECAEVCIGKGLT